MKWIVRAVLALTLAYGVLLGSVLAAMRQPPERFGQFMRFMPAPVVWQGLPATRMWLWARKGSLGQGDLAPDFTLPAVGRSGTVTLSSHRGKRPVVLVFGSYT
jgi:hypothetical protein